MAFDPSSERISRILKYVSALWNEGKAKYPDIKIKVGPKEFGAHRIILMCHSDYLCEKIMAESTINEITIPPDFNVTPEAFTDAMEFMYKSELALTPENLDSLMNLAKKLGMYHIAKLCETLAIPVVAPQNITAPIPDDFKAKSPAGGPPMPAMPWGGEDYVSTEKMWQPSLRPSAISHYMKYLWYKRLEESADFNITVSGQEFKAHKFILGCHSYFFSDLFKKSPLLTSWNTPPFLGLDPNAFRELLRIMYVQDIETNLAPGLVAGLKGAADIFKMSHISKALDDKYPMVPKPMMPGVPGGQVAPWMGGQQQQQQGSPPQQYMATQIQQQPMMAMPQAAQMAAPMYGGMLPFMQQQPTWPSQVTSPPVQPFQPPMAPYPTMMQPQPQQPFIPKMMTGNVPSPQAQQDLNEIVRYLSGDAVNLANEMDVFLYALSWLKKQPDPTRLVFKVMSCVRFYFLTRLQLQQIVGMTKDWFMSNPEYRDLIVTADWMLNCQRNNLEPVFVGNPKQRIYIY